MRDSSTHPSDLKLKVEATVVSTCLRGSETLQLQSNPFQT